MYAHLQTGFTAALQSVMDVARGKLVWEKSQLAWQSYCPDLLFQTNLLLKYFYRSKKMVVIFTFNMDHPMSKRLYNGFIIASLGFCCSCNLVQKVQESSDAIDNNRTAVQLSTMDIMSNAAAISQTTSSIAANREAVERSSQTIKTNGSAVEGATQAINANKEIVVAASQAISDNRNTVDKSTQSIDKNRIIIDRSTAAINANRDAVSKSTDVIKANNEAIRSTTDAILKNAQAIEASTSIVSKLQINEGLLYPLLGFFALLLIAPSVLMCVMLSRVNKQLNRLLAEKKS
jgi:hypothetical protein